MRSLSQFLNESEDMVYVVSDVDGTFIGVYENEEDAKKAKSEYEITPDMKAEIKKEKRSEYVK